MHVGEAAEKLVWLKQGSQGEWETSGGYERLSHLMYVIRTWTLILIDEKPLEDFDQKTSISPLHV